MELQERIERLESRESIRTLVADYSMAVDDRDVDTIGTLFAENGIFGHADGSAVMHGRQAIVDFYNGRLGDMGPTYHYPHSHKITFTDADTAEGIVLAHAELSQEGKTYYTGLRYYDKYQQQDSKWIFEERLLKFLFFMPMEELVRDGLTQTNRKRFPGQGQLPTDLPELQESWIKFLAEK
jgi:ketosteroid isomerase-like protein